MLRRRSGRGARPAPSAVRFGGAILLAVGVLGAILVPWNSTQRAESVHYIPFSPAPPPPAPPPVPPVHTAIRVSVVLATDHAAALRLVQEGARGWAEAGADEIVLVVGNGGGDTPRPLPERLLRAACSPAVLRLVHALGTAAAQHPAALLNLGLRHAAGHLVALTDVSPFSWRELRPAAGSLEAEAARASLSAPSARSDAAAFWALAARAPPLLILARGDTLRTVGGLDERFGPMDGGVHAAAAELRARLWGADAGATVHSLPRGEPSADDQCLPESRLWLRLFAPADRHALDDALAGHNASYAAPDSSGPLPPPHSAALAAAAESRAGKLPPCAVAETELQVERAVVALLALRLPTAAAAQATAAARNDSLVGGGGDGGTSGDVGGGGAGARASDAQSDANRAQTASASDARLQAEAASQCLAALSEEAALLMPARTWLVSLRLARTAAREVAGAP
ncbi:hypothetical protein T492DRAFT_859476, partial [Pavlovales sp. CCMP2436]